MRTIEQIAIDVRRIVQNAVRDLGPDLDGSSAVDLVLDNVPDAISTSDARVALVVAGVDSIVSARVRRNYSREPKRVDDFSYDRNT